MNERHALFGKYVSQALGYLLFLTLTTGLGQVWASTNGRVLVGSLAFVATAAGSIYILLAKRPSTFASSVRTHSYSVTTRWVAVCVLVASIGLFAAMQVPALIRIVEGALSAEPSPLPTLAAAPMEPTADADQLTREAPSRLTAESPSEPEIAATPTSPYDPYGNCEEKTPPTHPCYYRVKPNEGAPNISLHLFGTPEHGGKIADLHRDTRGMIAVLQDNERIIIPDVSAPRTAEYIFHYLGYPICDLATLALPCVYISDGENYDTLAALFYKSRAYSDQLARANDIMYAPAIRDIVPLTPSVGDLLIIPVVH